MQSLPSRRSFLAGSSVLTAAAALGQKAAAAPAERPNILLVISDDQPLGTEWGLPTVRREVAGRGVEFTHAYATTPVCCPSRSGMMTGQYTHNHRVYFNKVPRNLDQRTTVQRHLQEAGYTTGLFGKFLNFWPEQADPRYF